MFCSGAIPVVCWGINLVLRMLVQFVVLTGLALSGIVPFHIDAPEA